VTQATCQHANTEEGRIHLDPPFSVDPIPALAILFLSHYDSSMLKSVEIVGLRGIAHGQLTDLPPGLGVFVGPNGSGKSTILEALLLGASENPADAVGHVVQGRQTIGGARWLFHRDGSKPAVITAALSEGPRKLTLTLKHQNSSVYAVDCEVPDQFNSWWATVKFGDGNSYKVGFRENSIVGNPRLASEPIRLLAPYSMLQQALPDVYSDAVTQGRQRVAKEIIKAVVPGLENIEVLTDAGRPVVHLVFADHSVPVESSGDGVMALVRLALELAARPGGTVLIEEPEVHEHPAAMRQSAMAIMEATRRNNIQVLLSTHSLDFIDALLAAALPADLAKMCVYRCALDAGELRTTTISGTEVARLRGEIGEDLR